MEYLALSEINIDNPYLRFGTEIDDLMKSIQTVGLISPLVVNPDNLLLAGGRRYQALKELGHETVPVVRLGKNQLEGELISIDENLVRKDLNNMELEANLRRAKELYQEIAERDPKVQEELRETESEEEIETLATNKFVLDVSEKTGLKPQQIHQAIKRDELSAPSVKEARNRGELSLSQTNELIKLDRDEQEALLPHIEKKSVREIRDIVKEAKTHGIKDAVEKATHHEPHAREIKQLLDSLKKARQIASRLSLETVMLEGRVATETKEEFALLEEALIRIGQFPRNKANEVSSHSSDFQ